MRGKLMSLMAAAVTIAATPAHASTQTGTVINIQWVDSGARFLFVLSGSKQGTVPSCDCCNRWEVPSPNSASGQSLIAVILSAQAQQKPLFVSNMPTSICVAGANDTEQADYVRSPN